MEKQFYLNETNYKKNGIVDEIIENSNLPNQLFPSYFMIEIPLFSNLCIKMRKNLEHPKQSVHNKSC